ncbi:MAG TPA: PRC-barrel domain-containing protein [Kiritimatiellia bacterium]
MKRNTMNWNCSLAAIALALGWSGAAWSAEISTESSTTEQNEPPVVSDVAQAATSIDRASRLIGMQAVNDKGEQIGIVRDIVLAEDGRQIASLAIQPAGAAEADTFVQAPTDEIRSSPDQKQLTYDRSPSWMREHAREMDPSIPWSQRASQLLELEVRDSAGKSAGKVRDLLVDLANQRVIAASVASPGFLGFREKLASVTWSAVSIQPAGRFASIRLSADELRGLAYEENAYWQKLGFSGKDDAEANQPEQGAQPQEQAPESRTY